MHCQATYSHLDLGYVLPTDDVICVFELEAPRKTPMGLATTRAGSLGGFRRQIRNTSLLDVLQQTPGHAREIRSVYGILSVSAHAEARLTGLTNRSELSSSAVRLAS